MVSGSIRYYENLRIDPAGFVGRCRCGNNTAHVADWIEKEFDDSTATFELTNSETNRMCPHCFEQARVGFGKGGAAGGASTEG